MATTFTMTRDNIIKAAMRRVGALPSGGTPSTDETTDAAELLNSLIKNYDACPWFKWFIKSAPLTVTTANGTESYDLNADILWVESAVVTESSVFQPLTLLTQGEYASLQARAVRTGIPTHAFVSTDLTTAKMYLYPVPNATMTVTYWARRKSDIFDNASDTGDFPAEWYRALVAKLAVELAFEYGRPLDMLQLLIMEADKAEKLAMGNQVQQITGQEVLKPSLLLNSARQEPTQKRFEPKGNN